MMRILVADDDALSRTLLERTLERAGYEVTAVDNGRLAAEHLCCHVAGFDTWHKLGRHVRKGEKGIAIFAPVLRRKREPEQVAGQSVEEVLLGYRTAAVFDASQTEGRPLPSIGKVHRRCQALRG